MALFFDEVLNWVRFYSEWLVTVWMAIQTCNAVVFVTGNVIVFVVHFWLTVTLEATENSIVARIGVAIGTGIPFTVMLPAVYWKIQRIVIEGRGFPNILAVAKFALCGELRLLVRRVIGLVILLFVTSEAGVGRIIVIAGMTFCTAVCNGRVRTL
jgi:hypothetical protein